MSLMSQKKFPVIGKPKLSTLLPWQQELLDSGIPLDIQDYVGLELSSNPQYTRFRFEYPPDKSGHIAQFMRLRLLKSYVNDNPNLPLFINPDKELLPNGLMPPLYTPNYKDLTQKIHVDGGRLYMVEGASDTWVLYALGIYNSASLFAASSSLTGLAEALRDMGVKSVIYYTDSDNAGQNGAMRLWKYFSENSNTQFSAYNIQGVYNNYRVKDVRDLWLASGQNKDECLNVLLNNSVKIDFDFAEKLRAAGMPKTIKYQDIQWDADKIYQDIFKKYLDIPEQDFFVKNNRRGWSRNFQCPFHDDNHPSFGWNSKDGYGFCFAEGRHFTVFDLCDKYNLNWRDFAIQGTIPEKPSTAEKTALADNYESYRSGTLEQRKTAGLRTHVYLDEMLDARADRLSGAKLPQYPPLIMPLKKLHKYGGFAQFIERPRLIAVFGMSGGFKTTIFNALIDGLLRSGESGFFYSPEWSPDAHADRFTQMNGGVTVTDMRAISRKHHERALEAEGKLNPDIDEIFGRDVTQDELIRDKMVRDIMKNNYRGKLAFIEQYGSNLWDLFGSIEETILDMQSKGCAPSWGIIDYIQLVPPPPNVSKQTWNTDATILAFKTKIMQKYGLALFIATQVRKSDAESMRDKNVPQMFDPTSGNNISDWFFNLMLGVAPLGTIDGNSGAKYVNLKVSILKNSEGQWVRELDDSPDFYVDTKTMKLYEEFTEAEKAQSREFIDIVF